MEMPGKKKTQNKLEIPFQAARAVSGRSQKAFLHANKKKCKHRHILDEKKQCYKYGCIRKGNNK